MRGRKPIYAMAPEERASFTKLLGFFSTHLAGTGLLDGEIRILEQLMAEYPGEFKFFNRDMGRFESSDFVKNSIAFAITMPRSIYLGRNYKAPASSKFNLATRNRESSRSLSSPVRS